MSFRPWLWLSSQLAHDLTPYFLPPLSVFMSCKNKTWRSFEWRGLHFANPMGIAGGVDKSGRCIKSWSRLGAGFVEVGTVTPEPQGPNPGTIMMRDTPSEALWNKMGFPNGGTQALIPHLEKWKNRDVPLFVNIGKNRWTPNEQAANDYATCIKRLKSFADVFVVNVSSPNTKGLRDLLSREELQGFLDKLLTQVKEQSVTQPLLLKLSPDMEVDTLEMALETSAKFVDGWILTNTTKERFDLTRFPADAGGLSGQPLAPMSLKALEVAVKFKKQFPEKLLVSVGGVSTSQQIQQRLDLGADLVQSYSALVFNGPGHFRQRLRELQV